MVDEAVEFSVGGEPVVVGVLDALDDPFTTQPTEVGTRGACWPSPRPAAESMDS